MDGCEREVRVKGLCPYHYRLKLYPNKGTPSQGQINGAKTHCPHGHPYDEANTFYSKTETGGLQRTCRACRRIQQKRYRRR